MPRGRGKIERFFGSVNELFLPGQPGHLVRGVPASPPKLTLAELDAALHTFIVNDYNQRRHSETHQAPQQRWDAGGFLPHLPERLEDLDLLLLSVPRSRVVQRDGIRFEGMRYLDVNLAAFVGEPVTIRYDPHDLTEIRVFHDGAFLCTAVCQELANFTISLKDLQAARTRRRRELREEIKDRKSLVDELLAVHQAPGPPSPEAPHTKLRRYRND
jgi:putative transposase